MRSSDDPNFEKHSQIEPAEVPPGGFKPLPWVPRSAKASAAAASQVPFNSASAGPFAYGPAYQPGAVQGATDSPYTVRCLARQVRSLQRCGFTAPARIKQSDRRTRYRLDRAHGWRVLVADADSILWRLPMEPKPEIQPSAHQLRKGQDTLSSVVAQGSGLVWQHLCLVPSYPDTVVFTLRGSLALFHAILTEASTACEVFCLGSHAGKCSLKQQVELCMAAFLLLPDCRLSKWICSNVQRLRNECTATLTLTLSLWQTRNALCGQPISPFQTSEAS